MQFKQYLKEQFYNTSLHPRFWDDFELDNTVRKKLVDIATEFAEEVGVSEYITDIQLTGSIANYNYTKYSDLDVHILLPFKDINKDVDLVKDALDGKRWIWNERHAIIIRDHEVELYFQDSKEKHIASGLYSLLNDEWIREPKYDPPEVDEKDVISKAEQIERDVIRLKRKIEHARTDKNESAKLKKMADKLRAKVTKMRKDSLEKDGEFGVGNLAFKKLRNDNIIGELIDLANQAYDQIFSEKYTFKDYQEDW